MKKSVLLLGATSKIAEELSKLFLQRKDSLIWAARDSHRLLPLKKDFETIYHTKIDLITFDIEQEDDLTKTFLPLTKRVDIIICLVGYLGNQSIAEKEWKESKKILQTNFLGPLQILNLFAWAFSKRKSGTIVGISSVAGERGRQSNYFYGSAKAGLSTYLDGLRNQLFQDKVHVLTVKPGYISSKMIVHLKTPKVLTISPKQAAYSIYYGIQKKEIRFMYNLFGVLLC